jgi:hypothetical protein
MEASKKQPLKSDDVKSDGATAEVKKPSRDATGPAPTEVMHSAFGTMEVVIAVATMAALATLPMTTVQSFCSEQLFFCMDVLKKVHKLISLGFFDNFHGATLVELFPTGIMQFRALFCCWIAFSLLRFHRAQARYYRWFKESGASPANRRGFGYFCCRVFGIFQAPVLTQAQFHASLFLMAGCLVAAALPFNSLYVTRAFLFVALVMYCLHFSQLFCESRAGGHSTVIIPLVLIHLICADENGGQWSVLLLKWHIAFCYFSAGYGKVVTSIYFGKFWGSGKPCQYLFLEAMWSRPGGMISQAIQEFMFKNLWLNNLMGVFTLIFQLSVPLTVLDIRISWLFFLLCFGFHAGILVTTNISFMPYWVPAVLIFLFPHGAAPYDGPYESAAFALSGAYEANPLGFCCVGFYLVAQAIVTFGLIDLVWGDILPLTCEPMFVLPREMHDQWPKLLVMTEANCREAGHLEPYMHYCWNPYSKNYPMDKEAILNMPSKTLIFMTLNTIEPEFKDLIHPDVKPIPFKVWSNVPVDEHFQQNLHEIADMINDGDDPMYRNRERLNKYIRLQRDCMSKFQSACREERVAYGFDPSSPTLPEKAI